MKQLIVVIFFLFNLVAFSQKSLIKIKGVVFTERAYYSGHDTQYVNNAVVVLKIKGSTIFKTITKEDGEFVFNIEKMVATATLAIEVNELTGSNIKPFCGFYQTRDSKKIDLAQDSSIENKFYLRQADCMPLFPDILFEKNTCRSVYPLKSYKQNKYSMRFDSALVFMKKVMDDYPSITIKISGNADFEEKTPEEISKNRASYIKERLVDIGADPNRIETVFYGTFKFDKKEIQNKKLDSEKEIIKQWRRRASFSIVGFDYD